MKKENMRKYEGKFLGDFKLIKEISCYNHNFYIGLQRKSYEVSDLILAVSDDDNETILSLVNTNAGTCREFGFCYVSDNDEIQLLKE